MGEKCLMDKLRALQYFISASEEGSFSAAARHLNVSVPAVSKLISSLEKSLGASLFNRTSHGLSLTACGQRYLESCQPLLEQLSEADNAIGTTATRTRGVLVVGTPAFVMQNCFAAALPQFHARYPEIQLDFRIVNRLSDPEVEFVDVFVLFGWHDGPDFVRKQVAQTRYHVTASPAYWAAHGMPGRPLDLAAHSCLLFRGPLGTQMDLWKFERDGVEESVTITGWLGSSHCDLLVDAALAGEGVLRVSALASWQHVLSGRLVPVLRDWVARDAPPVNVFFRPSLRRTPRVRVFVEFVAELMGKLNANAGFGSQAEESPRPYWYGRRYARASSSPR